MTTKQIKWRPSFFGFMRGIIAQLKQQGRHRTAENYAIALKSFMRFRAEADLPLTALCSDLMLRYEADLVRRGVSKNTVSFYMRILRAVYNRAVEAGLTEQRHPFRQVYTGIDKTVKRAVPLAAIKRVKELELPPQPPTLAFARDMFLFSFYTRGMSFVDMAYLKKSDLERGVLTYRRRKTGQRLSVRWERCMAEIAGRYAADGASPYLLPILRPPFDDHRIQYRNALMRINKSLKTIAVLAGLEVPLSMYVARHSWASVARAKNIPLSVISEGMGHDSEATTRIYLASLDTAVIDRANRMILKDL